MIDIEMATFKPLIRKSGEYINAEDWNQIQEGLLAEVINLERQLINLKEYVNNMMETFILTGLESQYGKSYQLDELVPGETKTYETKSMGLITKQWLPVARGRPDYVCGFGITDYFEILHFWAAAENGDKKMLDVELSYVDGTSQVIGSQLFVNDKNSLSVNKDKDNPYLEFLVGANRTSWYKYQVINKNPEKKVGYIYFKNSNPNAVPRIGNVIYTKVKIKPLDYSPT